MNSKLGSNHCKASSIKPVRRWRRLRAGERPEERLRREAQVRAAEARLANARAEFERFDPVASTAEPCRAPSMIASRPRTLSPGRSKGGRADWSRRERSAARKIFWPDEAEVRGLEGRVVEANIQLQDTTLRAPYDGVIAQRFVEEGQNVRPKQPIVRFQDVEEIEIVVDVPETVMAADIQSADILKMLAELSGAPGLQFPGAKFARSRRSPTPRRKPSKSAQPCRFRKAFARCPGMTATVTVTYRRASILGDRILVPISAVLQNAIAASKSSGSIGADRQVARRPVKIGTVTGGEVEITDGLQPGDRIAVAGVTFLRDGMKVRDLGDALGGGQHESRRAVGPQQPRGLRGNVLVLRRRGRRLSANGPARRPGIHDQGSADHHALPRRQRRRGCQGSHQSDRKRLPATGPASSRRVGVDARHVGRLRDHPGPLPSGRDSAGLGRTASQDRRRSIAIAARRCAASRWWSTISATSTASSWPSPARATRSPSCAATPSSSAANCCWCRTSKASSYSAQQQEVVFLEISRQRLVATRDQRRANLQPSSKPKTSPPTVAACALAIEHIADRSEGRIPLGRRHARSGDRLGQVGPPAVSARRRDDANAAIRIRRAACSATTANRPSAWASPLSRAATW